MQKTLVTLSALASITSAAKTFGLVTIHSGSDLQYASVYKDNSTPEVFRVGSGSNDFSFTLNDDTSLTDSDGVAVKVFSVGDVGEVGSGQTASTGFSLDSDNNLLYEGKDSWAACPIDNYYTLNYPGNCINGTGVALLAVSLSSSSSSSSSSAASSTAVPTSSGAPVPVISEVTKTDLSTTLATVTSCAPEVTNCPAHSTSASNYTKPNISTYEGAAGANFGNGAGIFGMAVAAALVLI